MEYLLSVISGDKNGPVPSLLRGGLSALSCLYSIGLKAYLLPYKMGVRRRFKLPASVISIGNLTVGGTGKTPLTIRICEFLSERGVKVCVLSRGYKSANEFGTAVVSTYSRVEMDAAAAGDEAFMLASLLPGVPVVVGKDRRKSGILANDRFKPDVFVLDDGMQFYQLHRDIEIVTVNAVRPFDNGWTFPRGLLREPPSHLKRADAVVLTNMNKAAGDAEGLMDRIKLLAPKARRYTANYNSMVLRALDRSGVMDASSLFGRPVATFCALGNPDGFESQVRETGAQIVHSMRMPDHHAATMGELNAFITDASSAGAEVVVVTEKDAVKLPPLMRPLPFHALVVRMRLNDEGAFFADLLRTLGGLQSGCNR